MSTTPEISYYGHDVITKPIGLWSEKQISDRAAGDRRRAETLARELEDVEADNRSLRQMLALVLYQNGSQAAIPDEHVTEMPESPVIYSEYDAQARATRLRVRFEKIRS